MVLRDRSASVSLGSPWESLGARRFNGDTYERTIILLTKDEPSAPPIPVTLRSTRLGYFDITVQNSPKSPTTFTSVSAWLASPTVLSAFSKRTTIVTQPPPPASLSTAERLHIFPGDGSKLIVTLSLPSWQRSLGDDALAVTGKGALRAPMPSLVVEVKVSVGDKVEKGRAVVVLESMKTETVLRAEVTGRVRAVACAKGDMVEEGKELVNIEAIMN